MTSTLYTADVYSSPMINDGGGGRERTGGEVGRRGNAGSLRSIALRFGAPPLQPASTLHGQSLHVCQAKAARGCMLRRQVGGHPMDGKSKPLEERRVVFVISPEFLIVWVHSSVARAADRRSAGPWFKSGCALGTERPALDERIVVKPTRLGENIVWRAPATRSSLAILNLRHCFPPALGLAYATACKLCTYTLQDIRWTLHVDLTGETL